MTEFHPDEPVLVLKASDPLATTAIYQYAALCKSAGCRRERIDAVFELGQRLDDWQQENPKLVKGKEGE